MPHHPFRVDGRLSRLPYLLCVGGWGLALLLLQRFVLGQSSFAESGRSLDHLWRGDYAAYAAAVDAAVQAADGSGVRYVLLGLLFIAMFASFLALTARRLHDIGRPGGYAWISIIPFVGAPAVFAVLILLPGDAGTNRYNAAPGDRALPAADDALPSSA